jgi:hypothetical protein
VLVVLVPEDLTVVELVELMEFEQDVEVGGKE